jgi:ribonuclease R
VNINYYIKEKFETGEYSLISEKEIFKKMNITSSFEKEEIKRVLRTLESDGELLKDDSKRYALPEKLNAIRGKIKGNERGFGFLIPDDSKINDFFIPNHALNGAMHGDLVFAIKTDGDRGSSDEARVIKIIKRGYEKIVGTYNSEKSYGFVIPDDKNYFCDIFINFKNSLTAKTGDKVVAKITSYPDDRKNPEGQIIEVLGRQYSKDAEEKSVIICYNLNEEFPEKVIKEAKKVALEPINLDNRKDFRSELIITIDGEDARDLDDAISIEKLKNGNYKLGVHIADVSHYVTAKSQLDKEAFLRGTSVYFPDMVIPMLPRELSNGVCSLNEHEDKLTLSCVMEVDNSGKVVNREIVNAVINSTNRMTYKKVTALIEGDSEIVKEYPHLLGMISDMKELAEILIKKREERGSIDLDMKEAQITLLEDNQLDIKEYKRTISHKIIEEFMILANETVAEYMFYLDMPFLYRIHEKPSTEKLINFAAYVKEMGLRVKWNENNVHSKDFQNVLNVLEDTPLFTVVNRVMLRSMSKAKYHPINVGHFGLSSDCYCHFTSPIRRYPDLLIHRIIKMVLDGQAGQAVEEFSDFVYEAGKLSSEKEKNADEAERAIDDLYKARYMSGKIGEEFAGIISGVTSFGIFVELENTVEGLIKIDTLPRGRYDYDENRFTLKSNNLTFKLGEKIKIKVAGADLQTRKVEFIFIEK